jgi:hypothetical protein
VTRQTARPVLTPALDRWTGEVFRRVKKLSKNKAMNSLSILLLTSLEHHALQVKKAEVGEY